MKKMCRNCKSETWLRISNDLSYFLCGSCYFEVHEHDFGPIRMDDGKFIFQCYCGRRK